MLKPIAPPSESSPSQKARRRAFLSPIVDIVVTMGGIKEPTSDVHATRPNTLVLSFDNPKETAANLAHHDRLGTTSLSVGEGHTTYTIFKTASEQKQQACRNKPNTALHTGMGANPAVGKQAGQLHVQSSEEAAVAEKVLEKVLELTGGAPELVRVRFLFSIMGGTGGGLWEPIAIHLANALTKLGIPIAFESDALGSLTLTGVCHTGQLISGAILPALLDFNIDTSDPAYDLVTRRLELHELPPLGEQHERREQLLKLEEQAITSKQFRDKREITIPNAANHSRYGNIYLRETDFVAWLDLDTQVRPAVAATLYTAMHDQLVAAVTPDPSLQLVDLWDEAGIERPRPSVETVVTQLQLVHFPDFLAAIEQPGKLHQFELAFRLFDGSRFDAHRVEEYCCTTPETLSEAAWRLHLLLAAASVTEQIVDDCELALKEITREQRPARKKLYRFYRKSRKGWFEFTRQNATVKLMDHGHPTRGLADEYRQWEAKLAEASEVKVKLTREAKKLRDQFESIERALVKYLPQGSEGASLEYVRVKDPDQAFVTLLQLPTLPAEEHTTALCSQVASITLTGLAAMLDARFVDVNEIAQQIVFGPVAYRNPPFGGVRRQSQVKTFYALPPMDEPFFGQVSAAISRLSDSAIVVANESAACGAGVLRVRHRVVRKLDEVFVGVVKTGTVEAHSRPDREMLCLGDDQTLTNLGMHLNGDLLFSDPPLAVEPPSAIERPPADERPPASEPPPSANEQPNNDDAQ